jgi:hypothetical protein
MYHTQSDVHTGSANATWERVMDSLTTWWLAAQQTFPSMTAMFIDQITAWHDQQEINFPTP